MDALTIMTVGFISALVGFATGRYGDKWGGHLNAPHHWIYGLIFITIGIIYSNNPNGIFLLSFGVGHFVSDLNDFLHLRILGVDEPHEWSFWNIK